MSQLQAGHLPAKQAKRPRILTIYERCRKQNLKMAGWIDKNPPGYGGKAARLRQCGTLLEFARTASGSYRLCKGMFCNLPDLCFLCSHRRTERLACDYSRRLAAALEAHPEAPPYFVTLTLRPTTYLLQKLSRVRDLTRRMHRKGQKHRREGKAAFTEAARVSGAVHFTEVLWQRKGFRPGKPLSWLIHEHAIWLCDSAPDPKALSREWAGLTGGSFDVSVRPFDSLATVTDPASLVAALTADAQKLIRYSTKAEYDPSFRARWRAHHLLRPEGKCPRTVTSYGCLRGKPTEPKKPPAQAEPDAVVRSFCWSGDRFKEIWQ